MAGTAVSWKTTNIAQNAGQLWRGLAVPGAGARITLHTDGTPDSTANASAEHMGATKSGSKAMVKPTLAKYTADEFRAPIVANPDDLQMGISAEVIGVTDMDLIAFLLPGVGTKTAGTGFEEVAIGTTAIAYDCVAVIFPLIENTAKFGVFNIYNAINDPGVEFAIARKELGSSPVSLVGFEVTSRAATDTMGKIWKQV